MAYYTAVYQNDNYGWFTKKNRIYENELGFTVHRFQGKLCLLKNGYRIAELIEPDRLETKFKGSFENWIESIRKKDIQKVENLKEYQRQITEDIKVIENIWK